MKEWHGTTSTAIVLVAITAALSGCTTMGGNVKGSFACSAPAGVCSPTSRIDDQALAMISGGDAEATPSGLSNPAGNGIPGMIPVSTGGRLTRSSEKVLRIVFPAHIDRLGQYREASAIHAVVERGEWMSAANSPSGATIGMRAAVGASEQQFSLGDASPSLAELASGSPEVGFAETVPGEVSKAPNAPAALLPDLQAPSAKAVAAARRAGRVERKQAARRNVAVIRHVDQPLPVQAVVANSGVAHVALPASNLVTLPGATTSGSHGPRGSSPLQSIQDQVGSIFAARGIQKSAGTSAFLAAAKPTLVEHPANAPAVLTVSGVDQ